jgi:hypothetical protein
VPDDFEDLYHLLPPAGTATGSVSMSFVVARKQEIAVHWRYEDGKAVSGGVGALPDADLVLSIANPDLGELLSGEVEPSVAFMRGRLKASGSGAILLPFLASTTTPEFVSWRERAAALVDSQGG